MKKKNRNAKANQRYGDKIKYYPRQLALVDIKRSKLTLSRVHESSGPPEAVRLLNNEKGTIVSNREVEDQDGITLRFFWEGFTLERKRAEYPSTPVSSHV